MGSLVLTGNTSGSVTVAVPDVAGSNTATLGAATGTHYPFTAGTAVASTSGTSIDFTSIPSWVKRITVMLNGVSTNGTSIVQIQLGAGSVTTSGYSAFASASTGAGYFGTASTGFIVDGSSTATAANTRQGSVVFSLLSSNTWVANGSVGCSSQNVVFSVSGSIALGGTLDRVRITTVNGTDTFDAGSINILYE